MGNHSQSINRPVTDFRASCLQPGAKILVIKAIAKQHFVESTDPLKKGTVQQALPDASIRTAAENSTGGLSQQHIRGRERSWPAVGVKFEQPLSRRQPAGQVVSARLMPLPFSVDSDQADAWVIRKLSPEQRHFTAPVEDQMFVMVGPIRHLQGGLQKMLPPVHADGDDAQTTHQPCRSKERTATIRSSRSATAAQ